MEQVLSYDSFDRVVLFSVAAALLASVALSVISGQFGAVALTIQLLVAFVAISAARYGRRGGSAAAIAGSIVYVLVQGLVSASSAGPSASPLSMAWPIAAFGVVGIAGGQVLTWLKYDPARFASANALDDWSRLYNQNHFISLLRAASDRFEDDGEKCCVAILHVSCQVTGEKRAAKNRRIVRTVAQQILSGVRLTDDCARLDNGSFAVLFSGSGSEHGRKSADRLRQAIERQLRNDTCAVGTSYASLPDPDGSFSRLVAELDQSVHSSPSGV
jgi:hypothetical protein